MFLGAQKPALLLDVLVEAGKLSVNFCLDILKSLQTWPEGWVLTNSGLTSQKYVPILWVLSCGTDPIKAQIKSLPTFHPQRPRTQTDFNFQPALKLQILKLEPLRAPIAPDSQFFKNYDKTLFPYSHPSLQLTAQNAINLLCGCLLDIVICQHTNAKDITGQSAIPPPPRVCRTAHCARPHIKAFHSSLSILFLFPLMASLYL